MKRIILSAMMLCICLFANAQATDLVIDCQNPGWLSSMIKYGDQQTVRNLKVTGYVNYLDLKFIGSLVNDQNLDGTVDLSECNIVKASTGGRDNGFGGLQLEKEDTLKCFRIPKSATTVATCTHLLHCDTLYFDCKIKYFSQDCLDEAATNIDYVYVGEEIDSIPDEAFVRDQSLYNKVIKYLRLPKTTRYIGHHAMPYGCVVNFNDLENLRYLGNYAFPFSPDTIIVPKSLENKFYIFSFGHGDGQHIFMDENVKVVDAQAIASGGAYKPSYIKQKIYFHINKTTPPSLVNYQGRNEDTNLSSSTIYVPKGAREAYKKADYWGNATIIELNPIESMTLNENSIKLKKEEQAKLSVSISPVDADDQTVIWTSSDESVAIVDANGNVSALKAGEAWIEVVSKANPEIRDACKVTVLQPATGISLNLQKCTLTEIGESTVLEATVSPEDASNKNVKWKSSDESVCIVANGTVVAVGNGICVIIATAEDGGHMATCTVTVSIYDSVKGVNGAETITIESISDAAGRRINTLQRGVNILRMNDGTTRKVMVK